MNKQLEKFLKEINGGRIRNSQKLIADALDIDITAVSKWFKGKNKPSEENIIKMAKIFKKSQEEIENIFILNSNSTGNITTSNSDEIEFYKRELDLRDDFIKTLKEQIKNLKDKIEKLESK